MRGHRTNRQTDHRSRALHDHLCKTRSSRCVRNSQIWIAKYLKVMAITAEFGCRKIVILGYSLNSEYRTVIGVTVSQQIQKRNGNFLFVKSVFYFYFFSKVKVKDSSHSSNFVDYCRIKFAEVHFQEFKIIFFKFSSTRGPRLVLAQA